MRDIDLIEFIRKGRLGFVTVNSLKSDIKRVFGKPKHVTKWEKGQPIDSVAWVYKDLYVGFFYETEKVACLGIQPAALKKVEPNIGNVKIHCHGLKNAIEVDAFEEMLAKFEISPIERCKWDSNGWVLTFSSGVKAWFQGQIDETAILYEIEISH